MTSSPLSAKAEGGRREREVRPENYVNSCVIEARFRHGLPDPIKH